MDRIHCRWEFQVAGLHQRRHGRPNGSYTLSVGSSRWPGYIRESMANLMDRIHCRWEFQVAGLHQRRHGGPILA